MRLAPPLIVLAALALGFAVVEGATRLILPVPRFHLSGLELDRALGFRGVPDFETEWVPPIAGRRSHSVRLNADGFRGRVVPLEPDGKGPSIVFLGDSFLVGEAVPEDALVTGRVEASLRAFQSDARVYNLSVVDFGTGQQIRLFDRFVDRLDPDVVVLALYPSNDVANNAFGLAGRTRVSPGDAIRPYFTPTEAGALRARWIAPVRSFLRRTFRTFAFVERGFFPPDARPEARTTTPDARAGEALPREFLEVYRRHPEGQDWAIAWRETEALLRALRDRCAERDARLVVVVIPSVHQVRQTAQTVGFDLALRRAGSALREVVDWTYPETRLLAFGRAEGIEVVPLLGPLRRREASGAATFTRDHHLSVAGHAEAARVIATRLARRSAEAVPAADFPERVGWSRADDVARLSFQRAPHATHLSDGWVEWRPSGPRHPGGWRLGRRGVVALRAAPGPLVVEGFAAEPLSLDVSFVGSGVRRGVDVAKAGPFTFRIPVPTRLPIAEGGATAVLFDAGSAVGRVLVRSVGFAGAQSPRSGAQADPLMWEPPSTKSVLPVR